MSAGVEPRQLVRRVAPLALMPVAAFVVHQLRYWLAFGSRASAELASQGHSYLHSATPWLVLLIALAAGAFLQQLGGALRGRGSVPLAAASFAVLWLACAACLLAIYVGQEFLEGLLATGHPGGLTGIFGDGGWWSVPAAIAVGLVLAAVFYGARLVLREVARRRARRPLAEPRRPRRARTPARVQLAPPAPIAGGWSDRGPPR